MRIDLHTHTRLHSPCSALDPDELARLAALRGLDAIVLTEHNTWWNDAQADELRARHPKLTIYQGVELSTSEGYDVVVIGPSRFPDPGFLPFESLARQLIEERENTFVFMPHAFRFHPGPTADGERLLHYMDGIEMNSANILRSNWTTLGHADQTRYLPMNAAHYTQARKRHGLVPVFNSDAHHPLAVGAVSLEMAVEDDTPPPDARSLARALKKAHPTEVQDTALLGMFLDMF